LGDGSKISRDSDSIEMISKMTRRSMSTAARIEATYPIRIKILVPPTGLGQLVSEINQWLNENVGKGKWGSAPATHLGGNAVGYHFDAIDDAVRFVEAFPQLQLPSRQ